MPHITLLVWLDSISLPASSSLNHFTTDEINVSRNSGFNIQGNNWVCMGWYNKNGMYLGITAQNLAVNAQYPVSWQLIPSSINLFYKEWEPEGGGNPNAHDSHSTQLHHHNDQYQWRPVRQSREQKLGAKMINWWMGGWFFPSSFFPPPPQKTTTISTIITISERCHPL